MRFDLNQPGGFFWASFDFADNGKQNASIYADPLGSDTGAAGGEFIYSLPNGMMAFYVAANNGLGSRLTEAPTDVVTDPRQVKNNNAVTNGVSCNGCHQSDVPGGASNVDAFYQVSPTRALHSGDGTDRLSTFIKNVEIPQRAAFLAGVLPCQE